MTSSKIQDGASSSGRLRVIFGWSSGHARVMFVTISKGNRNLYMWMKGSAHTCGREFLSPSHCACSAYYACALRENVWRRFLMTDLMLEDEDCPSTYHQPTINLSSSHHQPTINPPSTYHQPDINLPSTWHQPHINPILQGSHLRVKKNRQIVTSFYYIANHKFTFKAYRDLRYLWQWAHNKSKSPMVLV